MATPEPRLPTRRLGNTDLDVTIVGFGGIPVQLASDEDALATIRRVHDLGVTFFDTARGYSNSEERIGKALEGRDYLIATKTPASDAESAYKDVCTSLANLRVPRIHLYQLHGVNDDDQLQQRTAPGGALDGLRRARDEGKILYIGVTGHRRETLIRAVETLEDFATVQVPFNLVEQEILERLVPVCRERDIGVIAMKPVGGGNFTNAPLAIKWCLNQPISVAIPGIATVQEAEEDIAVARDVTLTAEEQAEVERMKSELDQRTCRRCRYCEPCPNDVQIGMLLHGRSIVRRMGAARFRDWGSARIIASAAQCTECGECITKCPYELPIPELVREALAFYEAFPELKDG